MKTTTFFRTALIAFSALALTVSSCKKDEKDDQKNDSTTEQQLSKDDNDIQNASDMALNDASEIMSKGLDKSLYTLPCNVTVDSASVINDSIVYHITYNGLNCDNSLYRMGQMEVKRKLSQSWKEVNASVSVQLTNLKVTKVSNGRSVTLNGKKIFTNVSGGCLAQLGNGASQIVHKVEGSVEAKFDDNSVRTWSVARIKTFTGTVGNLVVTFEGFGSADGYSNLVTWGTTRGGQAFYTQISSPVSIREACEWHPVSGVKVHQIPSENKKATVTFGFDDNNLPVGSNDCPTRYKIDWQKDSYTGTIYLPL